MVDVDPYYERKLASMRCHKTQFTETSNFALSLPPDLSRKAFSQESFVLAQSRVATEPLEDDLFAGVR
jgi:LmbE family N-acetylglucosaminyl deacetylase